MKIRMKLRKNYKNMETKPKNNNHLLCKQTLQWQKATFLKKQMKMLKAWKIKVNS